MKFIPSAPPIFDTTFTRVTYVNGGWGVHPRSPPRSDFSDSGSGARTTKFNRSATASAARCVAVSTVRRRIQRDGSALLLASSPRHPNNVVQLASSEQSGADGGDEKHTSLPSTSRSSSSNVLTPLEKHDNADAAADDPCIEQTHHQKSENSMNDTVVL